MKKRDFLKRYLPLATVLINSDFGFSFGAEDLSMAWKVRVKLATFSAIESETLWNVDLSVGFAVAMVSDFRKMFQRNGINSRSYSFKLYFFNFFTAGLSDFWEYQGTWKREVIWLLQNLNWFAKSKLLSFSSWLWLKVL